VIGRESKRIARNFPSKVLPDDGRHIEQASLQDVAGMVGRKQRMEERIRGPQMRITNNREAGDSAKRIFPVQDIFRKVF
jgi:hypothetical protein